MSDDYTLEQEDRWRHTLVHPVGRGGAIHILHPDTGGTYCGAPVGRELVESEAGSRAPHCRVCSAWRDMLVNRERQQAWWEHEARTHPERLSAAQHASLARGSLDAADLIESETT